jgi:hypothetical protein
MINELGTKLICMRRKEIHFTTSKEMEMAFIPSSLFSCDSPSLLNEQWKFLTDISTISTDCKYYNSKGKKSSTVIDKINAAIERAKSDIEKIKAMESAISVPVLITIKDGDVLLDCDIHTAKLLLIQKSTTRLCMASDEHKNEKQKMVDTDTPQSKPPRTLSLALNIQPREICLCDSSVHSLDDDEIHSQPVNETSFTPSFESAPVPKKINSNDRDTERSNKTKRTPSIEQECHDYIEENKRKKIKLMEMLDSEIKTLSDIFESVDEEQKKRRARVDELIELRNKI